MKFEKFLCFFIFCLFLFNSSLKAQDSLKKETEEQIFNSFIIDQFIDEKISILSEKPSNDLNEHFIKSMKKFKSKAFKKLFIDYLIHKFSAEETQKLFSFYQARREFYQKHFSPEMQKKFSELITDLSLLLANVPDDEETGKNSVSFSNVIPASSNGSSPDNLPNILSSSSTSIATAPSSPQASPMKRFNLGEFVTTTRDDELHYLKIELDIGYMGQDESLFEKYKSELRDSITSFLMKYPLQRLKEDYIDHFLHKDIEKRIQVFFDKKEPGKIKIIKISIPVFMVN